MERNWAGNVTYRAARLERPTSVDAVRELVASSPVVRPLGTRHSFNDIADTPGVQISVAALPLGLRFDGDTVSVSAGTRYGTLAAALQERGLALPNLASLPHISIAGAIATGTHGSGTGCLATAVSALRIVGADGALRRVTRDDPEFPGTVVSLGTLGVVVEVTLDVLPSFELRQAVYESVPWAPVLAALDEVMSLGYSVSLFTDWTEVRQVWVKSATLPADVFGARPATEPVHMIAGESVAAVTEQRGLPGPWLDRLPHFRLAHKPSAGAELQSEYLVPRESAVEALTRLRRLAPRIAPLLQVSEVRSVAADELWLSGAYGRDVIAIHFTWRLDSAVFGLLPDIEAALLPLGARPHWGKCYAVRSLASRYPRWADFATLRRAHDPDGKFAYPALEGR